MKIIATSDWHLGNMFHGTDRLDEHRHFLTWLRAQVRLHRPDALLVAGDVFDSSNPSAASQSLYYEFLADVTDDQPDMLVVITAGNHDSAARLEAPRALLARHRVEIRGKVHRRWVSAPPADDPASGGSEGQTTAEGVTAADSDRRHPADAPTAPTVGGQAPADGTTSTEPGEQPTGRWVADIDDLIIPWHDAEGTEQAVILAIPYLRSDMLPAADYGHGAARLLEAVSVRAAELYPDATQVMMAHMYAKGADIARHSSEKIIIGGQEEVELGEWRVRPAYLTCGHIHKRQHIWGTDWARYTGSVLPMSFAERDYTHGVDLVVIGPDHRPDVRQLVYTPQRRLISLPDDDDATPAALVRLIGQRLPALTGAQPSAEAPYVELKVAMEKAGREAIDRLEEAMRSRDAILCRIQKVLPGIGLDTLDGAQQIRSIDDIVSRDPMEALRESFMLRHQTEMTERQEALLRDVIGQLTPADPAEACPPSPAPLP